MAPSSTTTHAEHQLGENNNVNTNIFPDGLKTSGQHNPIYSLLPPYNDYPVEISGQTVWEAREYQNNPERWTHIFSDDEIAELSKAADDFIAAEKPLTGMRKDLFPLPRLAGFFAAVKDEIVNGKGFILFKGIPVHEWGNHKCAVRLRWHQMKTQSQHYQC
jgi:hypothetical protein